MAEANQDSKSTDIKEYPVNRVSLSKIIFDPTNPNEMSDEQKKGLSVAMRRLGFLNPVILQKPNKEGKYIIINGEHRVKEYLESGKKNIQAFVVDYSLVDRKIARQEQNLLHGTHDPEKQALEIQFLQGKKKLEMLSIMIAQPQEQLLIQRPSVVISKDKQMLAHHEDTFLHGNLKQLYFIFTNEQYEKLMPRLETIKNHAVVDNNTDMFMAMVDAYEDFNLKKET